MDEKSIHMPTLLLFNSRFESGNLERAYKIEEVYSIPQLTMRRSALSKNTAASTHLDGRQKHGAQIPDKLEARYELFLSPDYGIGKKQNKEGEYTRYGLSKHTQWFYFSTKNISKNLKAKFAIKNLYKKSSAYSKGMRPFVFSYKMYKEKGISWHRGCEHVWYSQNYDNPSRSTLRFTYTYEYEDDIVYFAHFIPYTFTRLKWLLHKLKMYKMNRNKMKITQLWKSVSNLPWYSLKITSSDNEYGEQKWVFLTWRVHPGESNSSFMMEGMLNHLLTSHEIKSKFTYIIIPCLNPDGVYYGKYRWNMLGTDLNRVWNSPSKYFHPTVYYAKELLRQIHDGSYFHQIQEFNQEK